MSPGHGPYGPGARGEFGWSWREPLRAGRNRTDRAQVERTEDVEVLLPRPRLSPELAVSLRLLRAGAHDPAAAAEERARLGRRRTVALLSLVAAAVWLLDVVMLLRG